MPDEPERRRATWRLPVKWLGILPFVAFSLLFLILPTMKIVIGAFQSPDGGFTLQNLADLNTGSIRSAYWTSIKLSLITALLGCAVGFAMAAAVVFGGLPKSVRSPLLTFSGVASNFAGVPLAFAFIATPHHRRRMHHRIHHHLLCGNPDKSSRKDEDKRADCRFRTRLKALFAES